MSFGIKSIEHALSVVASDIVKEAKVVATVVSKLQGQEAEIEAITSLVSPQAAEIERAAFMALGLVANAANDTAGAASANGLSVSADAQTIADFKALYGYISGQFAGRGVVPPAAPAGK